MLSQVFDAVTSVEEFAGFTINEADLTLLHVHVVESFVDDNWFSHDRQSDLTGLPRGCLYKLPSTDKGASLEPLEWVNG